MKNSHSFQGFDDISTYLVPRSGLDIGGGEKGQVQWRVLLVWPPASFPCGTMSGPKGRKDCNKQE